MISVCYSGNNKIFKGLLLSVMSMVKHCDKPLEIIVLSMDIPEENPNFTIFSQKQMEMLEKIVKENNSESKVRLIDCTSLYKKHLAKGKNAKSGYTPYTLLRLLLDLIEDIPDKLAYIDMDTMLNGDVSEFYNIDLTDYELGAVRDHMGKIFIRPSYFNAGVMLLNIKKIKETGLFKKSREMVNNRKMIMPDQSAMNKYAKKKLYLPRKFNEQRMVREDTVIKHFCKGIKFYPLFFYIYNVKQWEIDNVHKKLKIHNFDDVYSEYVKMTLPE